MVAEVSNDVQLALICAGKYQVPVQAKGGGHSSASFSSAGGTDGGLVIDLRGMDKLTYDGPAGIAIAEGGMRLGRVPEPL